MIKDPDQGLRDIAGSNLDASESSEVDPNIAKVKQQHEAMVLMRKALQDLDYVYDTSLKEHIGEPLAKQVTKALTACAEVMGDAE